MSGLLKLIFLSTTILLMGCNEKVSPALQGASSSSGVPTVVPPSEYYFTLSNVSSYLLNYKLHKTGSGNLDAVCEMRKNVPLSNDLYKDGADPDSDITCYLEAEELALKFGGMDLEITASENTCEYVSYSPFSYYNRMPGSSSANITQIVCETGVADAAVPGAAGGFGINVTTASGSAACNTVIDDDITPALRDTFTTQEDTDLCRFNYEDGGAEQCDIGVINVTQLNVGTLENTVTTRTVRCGGHPSNCIKGPIGLMNFPGATRMRQIHATDRNGPFNQTFEFPGTLSEGNGNMEYANFRRNLASLNIDYGLTYYSNDYMAAFSNAADYTPNLMDRYTNNRMMDGVTRIIDTATYDTWSFGYNALSVKTYRARPIAAEPFMAVDSNYRTNPFYSFYCLDAAFDIKARIRLVVREWDRVFPNTSAMENISDINLSATNNARQDVYLMEEIPDDQDTTNPYNDVGDWDDYFGMTRTVGAFNSGTTRWTPTPTVIYTEGFFNPALFPGDDVQ